MRVLWDAQSATVAEVAARLKSNYSTVTASATIRGVGDAGLAAVVRAVAIVLVAIGEANRTARRAKAGRAFTYRPLVDQTQARRRALSHLVSGLFNNSPSLLVLNVLEDDRIDPRELNRLKQLIRESK